MIKKLFKGAVSPGNGGGECELHNRIFYDRDELTIFAVWAKCFERETKIIQIWAKFCHFGKNCQSIYQF